MNREQIMDVIDKATEPSVLKPQEALEFLDRLQDEIRVRMESLREENDLD